jgi:hypothetical protein
VNLIGVRPTDGRRGHRGWQTVPVMLPKARLLTWCVALAAALGACTSAPTGTAPRARGFDGGAISGEGATDPAEPLRITITSSRELPASIAAAARAMPGVHTVGERRSGLVDLRTAEGDRALPSRPAGSILPVSVEAHDPAVLAVFPRLAEAAAALSGGGAVLTESYAAFRGLSVGDALEFGSGSRRIRLPVGGIVPDGTFRSEFVVPLSAAQKLGVDRSRALVVAVAADAAESVASSLESLLGDFPARVRSPRPAAPQVETPDFGFERRQLSLGQVKPIFGEFSYRPGSGISISIDPAWLRANIVEASVPLLGTFRCHRLIVPLLQGAMNELRAAGLAGLVRSFAGCFNPRMQVPNDGAISMHAFGIAVDFNAGSNPYGATPKQDSRLVEVMERWGFTWGGRWTVPDGMHFEFSAFPDGAAR